MNVRYYILYKIADIHCTFQKHPSAVIVPGLGGSFAPDMVLLGSSADPNIDLVKKMMEESAVHNVKDPSGDKGDSIGVKDGCKGGEDELLKREKEVFVSAQLVAAAPHTMDKAMFQLNLKKPKVGGETK